MYFLEFSNWILTSSQELLRKFLFLKLGLLPHFSRLPGSFVCQDQTLCNVINAAMWSSGHYSICCALLWLLDNTATSHDLLSSCLVCCAGSLTAASFSVSLCCDGLCRIVSTRFQICQGREHMTMCPLLRTLSGRVPNHEHAVPISSEITVCLRQSHPHKTEQG